MDFLKTHLHPKENSAFFNPANIFLILGLFVGVLYSIFIPYGAGFDEETHQVRIMDIAFLNMLPNRSKNATITFREFYSLSYQRRNFNDPANDLFSPEKLQLTLNKENILRAQTRSVYSPVIFFPQAFVALVSWRLFHLPVIPVLILERLAGLLVYLAGAYFTIRLLPFGKWVFIALALAPMAMFQAATLNADGFTNAACFVFIGLTLKIYSDRDRLIRPWQVWSLVLLCVLIGLAKPGYFMLLPLALIIPRKCFPSKKLYLLLWIGIVLAVILTFGWMALSVSHSHFSDDGSQSLSRQLGLILANPVHFIFNYFQGTFSSILPYFRDWTGVYGYWVGEVPEPIYWLFPLTLLVCLLAEPRANGFSWKTRLWLVGLFLVSTGAIIFLYYFLHYRPTQAASLGRQGRYFIPTAPLLFLALAGWGSMQFPIQKAARILTVGLLFVVTGFYSLGIYATYYTACGYAQYAGGSCALPKYKNLNIYTPPIFIINSGASLYQTFNNSCGKLESVRIFIKSVSPEAKGTLRFSLLDSNAQVISSQDYAVDQIQPQDYLSLPVTPPTGSRDTAYRIRLESPDLKGPGGVRIALRDGHYYAGGNTTSDDNPNVNDAIFQYVCPNPLSQ